MDDIGRHLHPGDRVLTPAGGGIIVRLGPDYDQYARGKMLVLDDRLAHGERWWCIDEVMATERTKGSVFNAVDRYTLNDLLSEFLSRYGWTDDGSDEEGERLNDLTHEIGDRIDEFLNQSEPEGPDPDRMEDM